MQEINAMTQCVIGCAFTVANGLGGGFLEKVYENSLAHECRKAGLRVELQRRLAVYYDEICVGDYIADMIINDIILIEVKAVRAIDPAHDAQCIHYLAVTRLPICLLINFNSSSKVDIRRFAGPTAPREQTTRE